MRPDSTTAAYGMVQARAGVREGKVSRPAARKEAATGDIRLGSKRALGKERRECGEGEERERGRKGDVAVGDGTLMPNSAARRAAPSPPEPPPITNS